MKGDWRERHGTWFYNSKQLFFLVVGAQRQDFFFETSRRRRMNKKRKNLEYTTKIKRGETNQIIFKSKRCKRNLADPTEFCLATFFHRVLMVYTFFRIGNLLHKKHQALDRLIKRSFFFFWRRRVEWWMRAKKKTNIRSGKDEMDCHSLQLRRHFFVPSFQQRVS